MTCTVADGGKDDARVARDALQRVRRYLREHPEVSTGVRLAVDGDGDGLVLPRAALELLAGALAHMAVGRGVSVVPTHVEVTTQQAADMLNVSQPHLLGLLAADTIEHRWVGDHRWVRVDSLLDHLRRDDQRRRQAADALSAMARELGLD